MPRNITSRKHDPIASKISKNLPNRGPGQSREAPSLSSGIGGNILPAERLCAVFVPPCRSLYNPCLLAYDLLFSAPLRGGGASIASFLKSSFPLPVARGHVLFAFVSRRHFKPHYTRLSSASSQRRTPSRSGTTCWLKVLASQLAPRGNGLRWR